MIWHAHDFCLHQNGRHMLRTCQRYGGCINLDGSRGGQTLGLFREEGRKRVQRLDCLRCLPPVIRVRGEICSEASGTLLTGGLSTCEVSVNPSDAAREVPFDHRGSPSMTEHSAGRHILDIKAISLICRRRHMASPRTLACSKDLTISSQLDFLKQNLELTAKSRGSALSDLKKDEN